MENNLVFNRRNFIALSSLTLLGQFTLYGKFNTIQAGVTGKKIRFGIATDPHYADRKSAGTRFYRESLVKMREFVNRMNSEKVDFIIELGDLKDMDEIKSDITSINYIRKIEKKIKRFSGPTYHVLGNHDTDCITKEQFLDNVENTGIPRDRTYYSFNQSGMNFIVLDANFRSDGSHYERGNFDWTDSNIPEIEIEWLEKTLKSFNSPAIVFVHQRLDCGGEHCIKNAADVRKILSYSGKVAAVFQGHHHAGGQSVMDGVLYYTLKAMVEGSGVENNSYALVEAGLDMSIKIYGFRRAESVK